MKMRGAPPPADGREPRTSSEQAPWHALAAEEVLARLGSAETGLDEAEAAARLVRHGPNLLRIGRPPTAWRLLLDQLRSLVVALLFAAALVALAVGDAVEAAAIAAVLVVNTGLGFWTEWGARRAMEGLRRLQLQTATVRRGGGERMIEAAQLVPGDVILLEEGAAVPADARLLAVADLRVVEAPLTGESFPVEKQAAPVAADALLADRASMVYKGTLVVAGRGVAVVTATGRATEVGRISELVGETADERTPLEERLDQLGRRLVWITLGVAVVVTGVGTWRGGQLWLMVETGLALAIAAVPEGLPVVATITLAAGMRRMARRRALVRRLPAVETLGSTTLICTDKTGTLTAGEMAVTAIHVAGRTVEVAADGAAFLLEGAPVAVDRVPGLADALTIAALANRARLTAGPADAGRSAQAPAPLARPATGDPTEVALLAAARAAGLSRQALLAAMPEVAEVPFSSERMLMATFHRGEGGRLVACVKGAPGKLAELSSRLFTAEGPRPLDDAGRQAVLAVNRRMAADGLRVLALARKDLAPGEEPGEAALRDLELVALAGLSDPPAPGVEETIRLLHEAGVRTVMLTGDQRVTAEAIGRRLGVLREGDEVLDGRDIAGLDGETLAARVERVAAFSRVSPADKLRIVEAYQQNGEIVGMLGDGVNDAPALKRADIGVAMGGRGTDVAKETADIVLADDRFSTVAAAVEEGRVIFDNIRKFIFYLFSCNLSEVLVLFAGVAGGLPLPLLPLQILWLNLVTDVFPALALAVEPAEPEVMRRPPRSPQAALLSRRFMLQVGAYALGLTAATLGAFTWALQVWQREEAHARTIAFMALALTQLFHVFNARSPAPVLFSRRLFQNRWVWGAVGLTLALQLAVVYVPPLAAALRTRPLGAADWGLVLAAAVLPLAAGQAVKALRSSNPGRGRP